MGVAPEPRETKNFSFAFDFEARPLILGYEVSLHILRHVGLRQKSSRTKPGDLSNQKFSSTAIVQIQICYSIAMIVLLKEIWSNIKRSTCTTFPTRFCRYVAMISRASSAVRAGSGAGANRFAVRSSHSWLSQGPRMKLQNTKSSDNGWNNDDWLVGQIVCATKCLESLFKFATTPCRMPGLLISVISAPVLEEWRTLLVKGHLRVRHCEWAEISLMVARYKQSKIKQSYKFHPWQSESMAFLQKKQKKMILLQDVCWNWMSKRCINKSSICSLGRVRTTPTQ